ncbi:MAG: hypothetical protein Q9192_005567 [Flavoplaca navasiana]
MAQEHCEEELAYEEAAVFFEVEDKRKLEMTRCASLGRLQTSTYAVIVIPSEISLSVNIMGSQNVLESFGKGQSLRTISTIVGSISAGVAMADLLGGFGGKETRLASYPRNKQYAKDLTAANCNYDLVFAHQVRRLPRTRQEEMVDKKSTGDYGRYDEEEDFG